MSHRHRNARSRNCRNRRENMHSRHANLAAVCERTALKCTCRTFRKAVRVDLQGLRTGDPGPVHSARGARPGVARRLPQVRRLPAVPRRALHLLRPRGQDLLQERLSQVSRSCFVSKTPRSVFKVLIVIKASVAANSLRAVHHFMIGTLPVCHSILLPSRVVKCIVPGSFTQGEMFQELARF